MWSNIGKIAEFRREVDFLPDSRPSVDPSGKPLNDSMFIYADCHSSNKGLFIGLLYLVLTAVGIIIFFILLGSDECRLRELGIVVNDVVEIFILLSMIVASVWVRLII